MTASTDFLSGVIEGFYGRSWPWETRLVYADYLSLMGLNTFLYCPKGDSVLRKEWRERWPAEQFGELRALSRAYRERGLYWGVGLSPFEIYRRYGHAEREALRRKVEYLGELDASLLAILFDDMPGDLDALAERQGEIVADIGQWLPGVRLLVCPTYYSFDPLLEKYFGAMPRDYWLRLGRALPPEADIFWTGDKVCSESIQPGDVEPISGKLGRQVVLWDNYPVNDGPVRSNFLFTSKLADRPPSLRPLLRGHLCNPMNQGLLSLPALVGLAELYGTGDLGDGNLGRILGEATLECLVRDGGAFEREGLSGLGEQRCQELAREYGNLPGAAAREAVGWLRGEYQFDPDCLTD